MNPTEQLYDLRTWADQQRAAHQAGNTHLDRVAATIYDSFVARIDRDMPRNVTEQVIASGERVAAAIPMVVEPLLPTRQTICTATTPCPDCIARLAERGKAHP